MLENILPNYSKQDNLFAVRQSHYSLYLVP